MELTTEVMKELRAECAALVEVEKAAKAMVQFCYTQPVSGSTGWRGTANMYKHIDKYAADLRDRLAELEAIRNLAQ